MGTKDFVKCQLCQLTESGTRSLHLRRERASAVEVYKCLNEINPAFMCSHFTKRDSEYKFRNHNIVVFIKL